MLTFDISLFQYCYVLYCYKVISIKSPKGINFFCSSLYIVWRFCCLKQLVVSGGVVKNVLLKWERGCGRGNNVEEQA